MKNRLLFILKSREADWGYSGSKESGLSNSVRFVVDMLNENGIEAKAVEVPDNNAIDKEVTAYKPTHVIIEAFWVVPEKFDVLKPLHPHVKWIVRDHSDTPFAANEGILFGWTIEYLRRDVEVMCNSLRAIADMAILAIADGTDPCNVTYGPNVYPIPRLCDVTLNPRKIDVVNIGCFGAIRPLKNHMTQAIAAIAFARSIGAKLRFHINATRVEGGGNPILKNLRQVFEKIDRVELVEHPWMTHAEFLKVLRGIDICAQVSFTETFNIVAADAMFSSVPVVASSEIPWIGHYSHRDVTNSIDIQKGFRDIWNEGHKERMDRVLTQRRDMERYTARAAETWIRRFGNG